MVMPTGSSQDARWLGAGAEVPKDAYVAVFIPSETRDGQTLEHEHWRDEAVRVMSRLFGGATSVRGFGGWLDAEQGGQVKEEEISMVFSFISECEWSKENVLQLKEFLYRMGREAEQGAVGLHVMGKYLEIPSERYAE